MGTFTTRKASCAMRKVVQVYHCQCFIAQIKFDSATNPRDHFIPKWLSRSHEDNSYK